MPQLKNQRKYQKSEEVRQISFSEEVYAKIFLAASISMQREDAATKKSEEVCQIFFPSGGSIPQLKIQRKYGNFDFQQEGVCRP